MNEIFILTGYVFLVVFLILCLYKIYVALDAQLRGCPVLLEKKAKQKNTVYQKWLNLFMVCVFTIHNQGLSQFAFQEVHFNYNTQRFISTSRFIDTKNVGSRGHKGKLPPPPVPFPVQIQRIGKYIYSFSLCLYVRLSTQVCTRAVVR